ncbi:hypothetical protein F4604DRAFT_1673422 [Suillus subluteus]|nr:hypothetical protein F4604DRAFT_1673422 [Suillus subluteus]
MSPATLSSPQADTHPTPQHLMDKEVKKVMKEAKRDDAPKGPLQECDIPDHIESCKTLSTIMTTMHGVFKKEAQHVLLNHYSLTLEAGDTRSLTNDRETVIALLLVDHAYLFIQRSCPLSTTLPLLRQSTILSGLPRFMTHDFDELNNLDDLFSIGGAAVHNTLLEFQEGVYSPVHFLPASSSATEYKVIQTHNAIIHSTPALHSALQSIKKDMIAWGRALHAC